MRSCTRNSLRSVLLQFRPDMQTSVNRELRSSIGSLAHMQLAMSWNEHTLVTFIKQQQNSSHFYTFSIVLHGVFIQLVLKMQNTLQHSGFLFVFNPGDFFRVSTLFTQ